MIFAANIPAGIDSRNSAIEKPAAVNMAQLDYMKSTTSDGHEENSGHDGQRSTSGGNVLHDVTNEQQVFVGRTLTDVLTLPPTPRRTRPYYPILTAGERVEEIRKKEQLKAEMQQQKKREALERQEAKQQREEAKKARMEEREQKKKEPKPKKSGVKVAKKRVLMRD